MYYIQRIKELEEQIKQLQEDNKLKDIKIENMNLTINKFKKIIFGSGRERTPEEFISHGSAQLSFFCDAEEQEKTIGEIQKAVKEITVKTHNRKINKAGIRQDKIKDFDFEVEECELEDLENAIFAIQI